MFGGYGKGVPPQPPYYGAYTGYGHRVPFKSEAVEVDLTEEDDVDRKPILCRPPPMQAMWSDHNEDYRTQESPGVSQSPSMLQGNGASAAPPYNYPPYSGRPPSSSPQWPPHAYYRPPLYPPHHVRPPYWPPHGGYHQMVPPMHHYPQPYGAPPGYPYGPPPPNARYSTTSPCDTEETSGRPPSPTSSIRYGQPNTPDMMSPRTNNRYVCSECTYMASGEEDLEMHVTIGHLHYTPYECQYCQLFFPTETTVKDHYSIKHPGRAFKYSKTVDDGKAANLREIILKSKASSVVSASGFDNDRWAPSTPTSVTRSQPTLQPSNTPTITTSMETPQPERKKSARRESVEKVESQENGTADDDRNSSNENEEDNLSDQEHERDDDDVDYTPSDKRKKPQARQKSTSSKAAKRNCRRCSQELMPQALMSHVLKHLRTDENIKLRMTKQLKQDEHYQRVYADCFDNDVKPAKNAATLTVSSGRQIPVREFQVAVSKRKAKSPAASPAMVEKSDTQPPARKKGRLSVQRNFPEPTTSVDRNSVDETARSDTYVCKQCQTSVTAKTMESHVYLKHISEKPLRCNYCPFVLSYSTAKMKEHVKSDHPTADMKHAFVNRKTEQAFVKFASKLKKDLFDYDDANNGGNDGATENPVEHVDVVAESMIKKPSSANASSTGESTQPPVDNGACKQCDKVVSESFRASHVYIHLFKDKQMARFHCTVEGCEGKFASQQKARGHVTEKHRNLASKFSEASQYIEDRKDELESEYNVVWGLCFGAPDSTDVVASDTTDVPVAAPTTSTEEAVLPVTSECQICGKTPTGTPLEHARGHLEQPSYKCSKCSYTSKFVTNSRKHAKKEHKSDVTCIETTVADTADELQEKHRQCFGGGAVAVVTEPSVTETAVAESTPPAAPPTVAKSVSRKRVSVSEVSSPRTKTEGKRNKCLRMRRPADSYPSDSSDDQRQSSSDSDDDDIDDTERKTDENYILGAGPPTNTPLDTNNSGQCRLCGSICTKYVDHALVHLKLPVFGCSECDFVETTMSSKVYQHLKKEHPHSKAKMVNKKPQFVNKIDAMKIECFGMRQTFNIKQGVDGTPSRISANTLLAKKTPTTQRGRPPKYRATNDLYENSLVDDDSTADLNQSSLSKRRYKCQLCAESCAVMCLKEHAYKHIYDDSGKSCYECTAQGCGESGYRRRTMQAHTRKHPRPPGSPVSFLKDLTEQLADIFCDQMAKCFPSYSPQTPSRRPMAKVPNNFIDASTNNVTAEIDQPVSVLPKRETVDHPPVTPSATKRQKTPTQDTTPRSVEVVSAIKKEKSYTATPTSVRPSKKGTLPTPPMVNLPPSTISISPFGGSKCVRCRQAIEQNMKDRHVYWHLKDSPPNIARFKCPLCDFGNNGEHAVARHMAEKHEESQEAVVNQTEKLAPYFFNVFQECFPAPTPTVVKQSSLDAYLEPRTVFERMSVSPRVEQECAGGVFGDDDNNLIIPETNDDHLSVATSSVQNANDVALLPSTSLTAETFDDKVMEDEVNAGDCSVEKRIEVCDASAEHVTIADAVAVVDDLIDIVCFKADSLCNDRPMKERYVINCFVNFLVDSVSLDGRLTFRF